MRTFTTMKGYTTAVCLLLSAVCARGALVTVSSSTDNQGSFFYTVSRGAGPFTLGGPADLFSFSVRAYHVIDVISPPGWVAQTKDDDTYTWTCTNAVNAVVNSNELVFGIESGVTIPADYDQLNPTSLFPQGTIGGELYSDDTTPYVPPSLESVMAVNVIGHERFAYVGPFIPEPGLPAGIIAGIAFLVRRKKTVRV